MVDSNLVHLNVIVWVLDQQHVAHKSFCQLRSVHWEKTVCEWIKPRLDPSTAKCATSIDTKHGR